MSSKFPQQSHTPAQTIHHSYSMVWIALLGMLTALGPLSIDMYLPALPSMAHQFGVSTGAISTTLPAYFCGLAIGQLIYGPVSDRFGRKPPLYFGLTLFTLASIACIFAAGLEQMQIARIIQALGGCVGMVIVRAAIRDRLSPAQSAKAFSSMVLIMGIAPILAPLLGGWLLIHFSWHSIFTMLAAVGFISLVAIHFGFKETLHQEKRQTLNLKNVFVTYGRLLKDASFRTPALVGSFSYAAMFSYIGAASALLIDHFGVLPQNFGWYFGVNALGVIGMSQVNGRLVGRFHILQLLHAGVILQTISGLWLLGLAVTGLATLPLVMIGLFGVVAAVGLTGANGNALALSQQGHRAGSASALQGALQFALSLVMGLVVHGLMFSILANLALVIVTCAFMSFGFVTLIIMKNKRLAML
ncbi:Bcr/CflA family multidrug efflux MFS transporter [Aquirhabdus sp.]|uniref:Bcr/CflA family multidrug efflux MFS transporter n=1 Tax=Aquirhabdus sp. TaxID=2824160 RepID=UPI00396CA0FC